MRFPQIDHAGVSSGPSQPICQQVFGVEIAICLALGKGRSEFLEGRRINYSGTRCGIRLFNFVNYCDLITAGKQGNGSSTSLHISNLLPVVIGLDCVRVRQRHRLPARIANMQMRKRARERSVAASVQRAAQELADAEARRIPWQLLEETRRHYVDWQEFCFWARSVMESVEAVPAWLAKQIDNRCPGFLEEDRRYSAEHPGEGFLTPVRLGSWIDDHVFGFARKGGWLNAISYYAVRAPRYQRASVCWSQSVDRWRKAQPIRYPSFEEWLQDAANCDDAANLLPGIRELRQCFKLVAPDRLDQAVASYIDWEAFAYWCRPALEHGASLPETVGFELQRRCPGFLEFNAAAREEKYLFEQDWHRLMAWVADHFFNDAKREGWFDAILISVRNHPRAIRTMEYWECCDAKLSPSLPVPYPAFEYWRRNADQFVDLGED